MASLTEDPFRMFARPTLPASPSATSLLASEDGVSVYAARVGRIIEQYGREVVHASLSPSQARKAGLLTRATSGQTGPGTSRSDALQSSLESRLRALLTGSDLCEVTWKPWATPWGQSLSKPRARVRTTFGTDTGSWPTPTPTTRDHKDGGYCPNVPVNGLLGRMVWPTPRANEGVGGPQVPTGRQGGMALKSMVATWPTATAAERDNTPKVFKRGNPNLAHVSNGSSEPTEKPGALNPEFVCWLMGYPIEWVSCGVSVTRSTRGRRQPS